MFCVKEYGSDGSYTGHTEYLDLEDATILATNILEHCHIGIRVIITEIDYDSDGLLVEYIHFEGVKKMNELPLEMRSGYKFKEEKKYNIFIEFNIADFEYIKLLPNFIDIMEYENLDKIIHHREYGLIETEKFFIRFLGNKIKGRE